MINFPSTFNVKHKKSLNKLQVGSALRDLRKAIAQHMMSYNYEKDDNDTENNYFTLDSFWDNWSGIGEPDRVKIVETVIEDLQELGWNTKTSFGGTALFIYSTKEPPKSCWPDGM
jgi:IMP cyclohydrolase